MNHRCLSFKPGILTSSNFLIIPWGEFWQLYFCCFSADVANAWVWQGWEWGEKAREVVLKCGWQAKPKHSMFVLSNKLTDGLRSMLLCTRDYFDRWAPWPGELMLQYIALGCNPMHTSLGMNPIKVNRADTWVYRTALLVFQLPWDSLFLAAWLTC